MLGATAAVQPGPFQAFLLSLVSRHGWRRAMPAVLAPFLSDPPIVAVVLLVLTRLPERFLDGLRVAGGLFMLTLAWGAWRAYRAGGASSEASAEPPTGSTLAAVVKAALPPARAPALPRRHLRFGESRDMPRHSRRSRLEGR